MVDSVLRRGLRRRDVVESALQARGGCAARAWRLRCTGVEAALHGRGGCAGSGAVAVAPHP